MDKESLMLEIIKLYEMKDSVEVELVGKKKSLLALMQQPVEIEPSEKEVKDAPHKSS